MQVLRQHTEAFLSENLDQISIIHQQMVKKLKHALTDDFLLYCRNFDRSTTYSLEIVENFSNLSFEKCGLNAREFSKYILSQLFQRNGFIAEIIFPASDGGIIDLRAVYAEAVIKRYVQIL
jgi:hypothetical protein